MLEPLFPRLLLACKRAMAGATTSQGIWTRVLAVTDTYVTTVDMFASLLRDGTEPVTKQLYDSLSKKG